MALVQQNPIVTTAAAKLFQLPNGVQYTTVTIYNGSASPIYVGGSSVATSGATKGATIAAASSLVICLNANDALWAIAGSATSAGDVVVLFSGI
jgi:hypothetical protein